MLKIAICDDDKYICSGIENIIIEYSSDRKIPIKTETFFRGEDLYQLLKNDYKFDLIFLDIELNSTNGIIVSNKIRNEIGDNHTKIVFVTSTKGYEKALFDVQPFNFIEKPVQKEKVVKCLELLIKLLDLDKSVFEYKINRDIFKVEIKDIIYFECNLRKVKIVTESETRYFNSSLMEINEKLPENFIKPHGSFLVNYDHIIQIRENEIVMDNGNRIEISRRYKKHINDFQIRKAREIRNVGI